MEKVTYRLLLLEVFEYIFKNFVTLELTKIFQQFLKEIIRNIRFDNYWYNFSNLLAKSGSYRSTQTMKKKY